MKRFRFRLLIAVLSFAGAAACQTTTVTSASGGLKINGTPVNGTVTISSQGPVAVSGGGLTMPSAANGYVTQCAVSAGAIASGCTVPSSTLSNGGNGVRYTVLVTDGFAGQANAITNVSISGASWALDQYVPPSTVSTAAAFTYTTGSGAPTGACSGTSLYGDTSGSQIGFYGCKGGSWVSVNGGNASVTLGSITALGTLTNNISGNAATATTATTATSATSASTATNFDHTPNQCTSGSVPTGITAHGDANGCAPVSSGGGAVSSVNGQIGAVALTPSQLGAAPAVDVSSQFARLSKSVIDLNHFYFNDGTDGWAAAPWYAGKGGGGANYGMYSSDFLYTAINNPGYFTAAQLKNVVAKFMAALTSNGDMGEAISAAGAITLNCTEVTGADYMNGCFHENGDSWISIPQIMYLYYQKSGDTSLYTTYVAAIKTALGRIPRDPGGNHLVYVTPGSEYVACTGYREQGRFTGDDACASVNMVIVERELATMATAAGDSTNAATFTSDANSVQASVVSVLSDPTSHMLMGASIQNNQIDVLSSVTAVYFGVITGTQATQISTWLASNYSTIVKDGFVRELAANCQYWGTIGTNGGAPYGQTGWTASQYQCGGFWGYFSGWTAYTISLTNRTLAGQMIQTYISNAPSIIANEWLDSNGNPGGVPNLMSSPQGMYLASQLFPSYATPAAVGTTCTSDGYGGCFTPGAPAIAAIAGTAPTLVSGSTSISGQLTVAAAGSLNFSMTFPTLNHDPIAGAISAPHQWNCTFTDANGGLPRIVQYAHVGNNEIQAGNVTSTGNVSVGDLVSYTCSAW